MSDHDLVESPHYRKFHPRWYRERIPIFWWVRKWMHVRFILRELTSVAVAAYAVVLLLQIRAMVKGPEAYAAFVAWLQTPFSILLHAIALLFVIFHSVTWFNLAPKALVVSVGKKRIPPSLIAASNYAAWLVISIAVAWILIRSRS